ncbi:MAG: Gfo/Idh/MocA family oxidoreductase [Mariniblastus sp.]|nr:Gfo/Idh/MocA family oxidoreductase [Mariniblastus sp.]
MSVEKCRWGFLSTAEIGFKNWKAINLSGNGTVVAVASRDSSRSQEFIDQCQSYVPFQQAPQALGSYQELIDHPEVDAVYIPLPTGMRKEWVIKAANAGKHVLCEKPCAINATDLKTMIDACENNNVQFMDGVMYMHTDRLASMRSTLDDSDSIGELRRIAVQFSFCAPDGFKEENIRTDPDLEPHGCLGDLGWYTIRFILWAMNYQMPQSVTGRILTDYRRTPSTESVPMEFSGDLVFENGVSASFYNSFITEHQQWANLSGSKGNLTVSDLVLPFHSNCLDYRVSQPRFNVYGCDFNMEDHSQTITTQEYSSAAHSAGETKLFTRFSSIATSGRREPQWPDYSLKTQQVLDKCYESARNGSRSMSF